MHDLNLETLHLLPDVCILPLGEKKVRSITVAQKYDENNAKLQLFSI